MALKKSLISKIHVAKTQLGLDDEVYRQMLQRVTGKASSKDLTEREAGRLIAEFRAKGFIEKSNPKTKGKPHNFKQLPDYIKKIEALLADMQLPWAYADKLAKHMFKIDKVAWLKDGNQYEAILVALNNKHEIICYTEIANEYLVKLEYSEAEIKRLLTIKGEPKDRISYLKNLVKKLEMKAIAKGIEL